MIDSIKFYKDCIANVYEIVKDTGIKKSELVMIQSRNLSVCDLSDKGMLKTYHVEWWYSDNYVVSLGRYDLISESTLGLAYYIYDYELFYNKGNYDMVGTSVATISADEIKCMVIKNELINKIASTL